MSDELRTARCPYCRRDGWITCAELTWTYWRMLSDGSDSLRYPERQSDVGETTEQELYCGSCGASCTEDEVVEACAAKPGEVLGQTAYERLEALREDVGRSLARRKPSTRRRIIGRLPEFAVRHELEIANAALSISDPGGVSVGALVEVTTADGRSVGRLLVLFGDEPGHPDGLVAAHVLDLAPLC
jgi:hypothetical protein